MVSHDSASNMRESRLERDIVLLNADYGCSKLQKSLNSPHLLYLIVDNINCHIERHQRDLALPLIQILGQFRDVIRS